MQYIQVKVDRVLNKITKKDTLFNGDYTIDPYQNCEFGCLYCDSSFEKKIYIKKNAVEIFEKEIKNVKKGTIIVGSVHDPYQEIEKEFKITRELLKIIKKYDFSCNILTKSDLVLRDIDLISVIRNCRVTVSICSLKKPVWQLFEKNVPSPKVRLEVIKKFTGSSIDSGLAVLPILPYITDDEINEIIKSAKNSNAKFLIYKHLELKGDQKTMFFEIIKNNYPNLLEKYEKLYEDSFSPKESYIIKIDEMLKNKIRSEKID